jgi:alginate biosynthesis protein Alg44
MNAISTAQITHESETQRQYPRFPLPARAIVNGKEYEVKNLSMGGVALSNVKESFAPGKKISMDLKLIFSTFSLGITLNAEVRHYSAAEKILGCQFINQGPEQISFLNYAIKSFIAGDIVTSENVLNIASRNNFTKVRTQARSNPPVSSFKRQLPRLFLVLAIGVLIATLIAGNLYNSMFIVKANDATVMGPSVAVHAAAEGVFRSRLDPGLTLIQQNQTIGTITPVGGGSASVVQSPCNCYIARTFATSGEQLTEGQQIMSLVPIDAKPWIVAEIDPSQGKKISPESPATVSIFGSRISFTGHAVSMESPLSDIRSDANRAVLMKIILDQKLPVDFVNRLASVTFAIH